MNPTVEAGLITGIVGALGVTSTVVVAITGSRTTRHVTDKTLRSGIENTVLALDAARDDRLWERKADAYTDAIQLLRHRLEIRRSVTGTVRYDEDTERRITEQLGSFSGSKGTEVDARLLAYSGRAVSGALQASFDANEEFDRLFQRWKSLADQAREAAGAMPPGPVSGTSVDEARKKAMFALEKADARDEELLAAIRADLHDKPSWRRRPC